MRRIELAAYGPPEALEAVERPPVAPGPGEVVVKTLVAGINRSDCMIRAGEWKQAGGWPYVPGLEVAGLVARVGEGVDRWREGDAVLTMMQRLGGIHGTRPGGYQDEVCVPAATLARVPAGMDAVRAGELGLPAVTASQAIDLLEVKAGMRALVLGGSSAVGSMAIQILAKAGATVVATGTRPEKFALLKELGAAETLSTREPGWAERLAPVDRVFDLVGAATFGASVGKLTSGGRLVFVGGISGGDVTFSGWDLMRPLTLTGYSSERMTAPSLQATIDRLAEMDLRAEVTRVPLPEAGRAHTLLESGQVAGRVVLIP